MVFVFLFLLIIYLILVSNVWGELNENTAPESASFTILMCFVLGSDQCITSLFSRLIYEQVIWEFLGAYLHKPFQRQVLTLLQPPIPPPPQNED